MCPQATTDMRSEREFGAGMHPHECAPAHAFVCAPAARISRGRLCSSRFLAGLQANPHPAACPNAPFFKGTAIGCHPSPPSTNPSRQQSTRREAPNLFNRSKLLDLILMSLRRRSANDVVRGTGASAEVYGVLLPLRQNQDTEGRP